MLDRIKEVVAVANSPVADVMTKKQALEYLDQVKLEPAAPEIFFNLLRDTNNDEITKFFALQALIDIINGSRTVYQQLEFIKTGLLELLRNKITNEVRDPEYVRNKIAEMTTGLFYKMYGEINDNLWGTFFQDIIAILCIECLKKGPGQEYSPIGLDYFNRICGTINSEIADQTFVRSRETQLKNNSLKDCMRIQDVEIMTRIWLNSLKSIEPQQQRELAQLTLSCIGSYISWIDVNLVVNDVYISVIYGYLDFTTTKIACAQCLCEIISKKMKPMDKLTLLRMLNLTDKVTSIEHDDLEVYEQMAKLTNAIALELAKIFETCISSEPTAETEELAKAADMQIINQEAPLLLKFMEHEYDSVSQQCFPFISQYLAVLKKQFALGGKPGSAVQMNSKRLPLDPAHQNFLASLLAVSFKKMRIDNSSNEDSEDEIDEFNDTIRSKLKVFQDSIAVISPALYLESISNHIQTELAGPDWRDLELAIYQMHNLSESIRNNLLGMNKSDISGSEATMIMSKFMSILLGNSTVFQMDVPFVQILFFELVVRHYQFLNSDDKNEIALLNIFCSPFGMFNKREKVRLRTWYLFTRLIKITKPKLTVEILSQIIRKISALLSVRVVVNNQEGVEDDATFDSQLYLFEGIGILIGANSDSNYDIIDEVLTPLFTDLETCISAQTQNPATVLQAHHLLMAIGTLARGVHGGLVPENQVNNSLVNKKLIQRSLVEKFCNIAEVVLVSFSFFSKHESIRDASRFTFARLTPVLNNEIVPYASKLIALFLDSDLTTVEMNDFLGFLGQMIHMFHTEESCYQLFDNLLVPVINKVHASMTQIDSEEALETSGWHTNGGTNSTARPGKNVVVTNSFRDKILLKKAYYAFLQSFVHNSVTSLLLSERNRGILSTILEDLLTYMPQEVQETSTIKLALNVLANLVRSFGSGKCMDEKDIHAAKIDKLEGLNEFLITKIVPLVFEIPFKPENKFNIKDGSCRVVACDLSRLLREIYLQSGATGTAATNNPCLKYMLEVYLPQIQFPSDLSLQFAQALATSDAKSFEKCYVDLIGSLSN
ncbi:hypothetical protein HG537_0H04340 [Torulaspora globosa]|uniref:Exportin-T n=1 Tax=Torulaspora globosa TaxID=48254 RepID=A0A7H9HZ86_9SACH|nr:hypothetical protein HG537_0H04340 [Torulaspora sp. CBS 2947]